jgi:hypothetical protein
MVEKRLFWLFARLVWKEEDESDQSYHLWVKASDTKNSKDTKGYQNRNPIIFIFSPTTITYLNIDVFTYILVSRYTCIKTSNNGWTKYGNYKTRIVYVYEWRCQASCTSQRNQKSELIERASIIHLYTSTPHSRVTGEEKVDVKVHALATWTKSPN